MKKNHLEIISSVGSVAVFIVLITLVATFSENHLSSGIGYTAALLVFIVIMGLAGLKLARIPDSK